jgi:hypothetical protein
VEVSDFDGGFANSIKKYLYRFLGNLSTNYTMVEVVETVEVLSRFLLQRSRKEQ